MNTMITARKDSVASKAAAARRRQRVLPNAEVQAAAGSQQLTQDLLSSRNTHSPTYSQSLSVDSEPRLFHAPPPLTPKQTTSPTTPRSEKIQRRIDSLAREKEQQRSYEQMVLTTPTKPNTQVILQSSLSMPMASTTTLESNSLLALPTSSLVPRKSNNGSVASKNTTANTVHEMKVPASTATMSGSTHKVQASKTLSFATQQTFKSTTGNGVAFASDITMKIPPPTEPHVKNQQQKQPEQFEEPTLHPILFAEDLEPLVDDPMLDASCLTSHATVQIRSALRSLQFDSARNENNKNALSCAAATSNSHTNALDSWELVVVAGYNVAPANNFTPQASVCFGDRITLRSITMSSTNAHDDDTCTYYLGVDTKNHRVGCFASSRAGPESEWTLLRYVANTHVRVGPSAMHHEATHKLRRGRGAPVRSGDAVVLRNCATGGLLALQHDDDTVGIVTDSYHSTFSDFSTAERETSLLDRLQQHGAHVPSQQEILRIVLTIVPPLPIWSFAGERPFLDCSYLLHNTLRQMESASMMERKDVLKGPPLTNVDNEYDAAEDQRVQLSTPEQQELLVVDELLGSFLGVEGQFIRIDPLTQDMYSVRFYLCDTEDVTFDTCLRSLIEELLPLSTSYVRVHHFVVSHLPGYEFGSVMHAFCESVDLLLQEYVSHVAKLTQSYRLGKAGSYRLRTLQVDIIQSMNSMVVLQKAVEAARDKAGGALINTLQQLKTQTFHGDMLADRAMRLLLDRATVPYMRMLSQWLECGVLDDPYGDFMIKLTQSTIWEDKYKVDATNVLENFFSTKQTIETVLNTGRYWNAVRAHEANAGAVPIYAANASPYTELVFDTDVANIAAFVHNQYRQASKHLVQLLLDEHDLIASLRLMKRYYLLDQGDFFVNFMDAAEDELLKEIAHLSRGRIQHWLNVSIQLTEHGREADFVTPSPQKENYLLSPSGLLSRFAQDSLMDQLDRLHAPTGGIDTHEAPTPMRHKYGGMTPSGLTGLDAFLISFSRIPFPVSLVLNTQALARYQLLFRHLFYAKHVERSLVGIWQDHQAMKELQKLRGTMGPTFLLRQRMLHFLQNLIYYMMIEVIEPNWAEMEAAIASPGAQKKEQTIDDILDVHNEFLRKTFEACLLNNRILLRALTKLMNTCLLYADQMKRFMKATKIEEDKRTVATEKRRTVRRTLNDRGGNKASLSHKRLQESLRTEQEERANRIQRQTTRVKREVVSESYQQMIARFEEVFSENLDEFMSQLKHTGDIRFQRAQLERSST